MVRKMANYDVLQRTKDGYFDANVLLTQWNDIEVNPKRQMTRFLDSPKTKEFIEVLQEESLITEMQDANFQAVMIKKGRGTAKGKTKDEIWMHPYIFIDFAMWLNPRFKYNVIKFVYDQLIQERNVAGDNYKVLSSAGSKLQGYDYVEVAKALQWIVFGKTEKGLRQTANEAQLRELNELQMKLAFAIDMGMIETYADLISKMQKAYRMKNKEIPIKQP